MSARRLTRLGLLVGTCSKCGWPIALYRSSGNLIGLRRRMLCTRCWDGMHPLIDAMQAVKEAQQRYAEILKRHE